MDTELLLTILLPNRGRSIYLDKTLENLREIRDQRVEIVVLENSHPEFPFHDWRFSADIFRVESSTVKLSMTKNWHRGLTLARGRWLCFLGSDDGVVVGNLPKFLDFLQGVQTDVVSTHPIYFQYPLEHKRAWADLPSSKLTWWTKEIRYPSLLAALFPQFKLDLPVPYNRCVVRSEILKDYASRGEDIEGVSPDDFLAQYLSQRCRTGTYVELPIFIHGGSERSNGYQVGNIIQGNDSLQFLQDASRKYGPALQKFGISCSFALAFEHYSRARTSLGGNSSIFLTHFSLIWADFLCPVSEHHSQKPIFRFARSFLVPTHKFCYRLFRKLWVKLNFKNLAPVSNHKVNQNEDMDIVALSHRIFETS
jgi:hypothetical protein